MNKFIPRYFKIPVLSIHLLFFFTASPAQVHTCVEAPDAGNAAESVGESGVYSTNAKWTNGAVIKVKFLNGSEYVKEKVKKYAVMWERYANIKFDFLNSYYQYADVRITFNWGRGRWSVAGNAAASMSQNEASMNFGWFNEATPETEFQATTLHEFGHALGLLHEHKSPFSKIKWNLPVVYAYYMQSQGWSKQKVDDQVINRYSVTMSNKEYDPYSIMHYPVPAEHTIDGYSVGWNYTFSEGDKKLIGELYPFSRTITRRGSDDGTTVSCTLNKLNVEHNVFEGGKKGMRIKASFQINNALYKVCRLSAYFYYSDGRPLKDFNQRYRTTNGNVSAGKDFTPIYNSSVFTDEELFMPYDELHMSDGKHNLKFSLTIWDYNKREIAEGGTTYFTYTSGPVFSDIETLTSFENYNNRFVIKPKFSVENAKGNSFMVYAYFYFNDGREVRTYNSYTGRYEPLTYSNSFMPGFENTTYNYGYYSDLYLYIPYYAFPVYNRRTDYKYYVSIFRDGKQVATSKWFYFYLTR